MAAVTNAVAPTASTTNATSYASPSFTPTARDLLVLFVPTSGTTATGTATASANGITFTKVGQATKGAGPDTLYCFIANQLVPPSPASMTTTFDCTGDTASGAIVCIALVSGMSRAGLSAIRTIAGVQQVDDDSGVAGGVAPSTVFPANALTTNPTIQGVLTTVGSGSTPPTNWTERVDATYATPTTGGGYSSRDSGFTGTTITLGSTANGNCCAYAIELDASPASFPTQFSPRRSRRTLIVR